MGVAHVEVGVVHDGVAVGATYLQGVHLVSDEGGTGEREVRCEEGRSHP